MLFDHESRGGQIVKIARAGLNIKNPLTLATLEMMVVGTAGHFIAMILPRQHDSLDDPFVLQRFEMPVHGRNGHLRRTARSSSYIVSSTACMTKMHLPELGKVSRLFSVET